MMFMFSQRALRRTLSCIQVPCARTHTFTHTRAARSVEYVRDLRVYRNT